MTENGKEIKIETLLSNKISDIKAIIQNKTGIQIENQKLFCNDNEFNDNDTIQVYTFGGRLDLVSPSKESLIILIKFNENIFPIETNQSDTSDDIKRKIMQKEKFLIEDQILEFNNEVLIGNKTLQDCSISNGSILNLIFDERKCTIHIDVIELRGKFHELNVMKYDTVENVKKKNFIL